MQTINMHDAKTHLSDLIDKAVNKGESFIIAKAGKPMVRVTRVDAPIEKMRTGFLVGQIQVPDDFDVMGAAKIQALFEGAQ
jgi:prevent-host-death family protein